MITILTLSKDNTHEISGKVNEEKEIGIFVEEAARGYIKKGLEFGGAYVIKGDVESITIYDNN